MTEKTTEAHKFGVIDFAVFSPRQLPSQPPAIHTWLDETIPPSLRPGTSSTRRIGTCAFNGILLLGTKGTGKSSSCSFGKCCHNGRYFKILMNNSNSATGYNVEEPAGDTEGDLSPDTIAPDRRPWTRSCDQLHVLRSRLMMMMTQEKVFRGLAVKSRGALQG
ncbi:hypothetical protein Bbelb_090940 [Branchiostoma belcheri]|nr:hypothetical protein Bbelb_090940 [Branchiostoma belcheri]